MRSLNRNKRLISYARYEKDEAIFDEYGNETGESIPVYANPVELRCNVSAASGAEAVEAFGSLAGYSRIVCVADPRCPLDEKSIVWFGVSTDEPHNYIVTRKADSKNGILYALQEVKVRA
jgi:hypothetical protein